MPSIIRSTAHISKVNFQTLGTLSASEAMPLVSSMRVLPFPLLLPARLLLGCRFLRRRPRIRHPLLSVLGLITLESVVRASLVLVIIFQVFEGSDVITESKKTVSFSPEASPVRTCPHTQVSGRKEQRRWKKKRGKKETHSFILGSTSSPSASSSSIIFFRSSMWKAMCSTSLCSSTPSDRCRFSQPGTILLTASRPVRICVRRLCSV